MWQLLYSVTLHLSLQSSAVEQVLDILMDILSWEIARVVSPCLPPVYDHILCSEFSFSLALFVRGTLPIRCYPLVHSRGRSSIRNLGMQVVSVVPQT